MWDREFGFLREMMVAPVRRSSIVLGKVAGGATVATFQGLIVIAIAGLVEIPYELGLILELFALSMLLAFAITAFGVMFAARINQMQSFMALMQMVIMPMFFLSGAMFSVANLPQWLAVLNRLDPLTYAVDPMRRAIFSHLDISAAARQALDPGVTWFGWRVPTPARGRGHRDPRAGHARGRDLGVFPGRVVSAWAATPNTVRPLTSNGAWLVREMRLIRRSTLRARARGADGAARSRRGRTGACAGGSGQVEPGQIVELRPCSSRYQLTHPPEVQTLPSSLRWSSSLKRSCTSGRTSNSARAGAIEVGDAVHQVVQLGLDHEHDRVVPEPGVRADEQEQVGKPRDGGAEIGLRAAPPDVVHRAPAARHTPTPRRACRSRGTRSRG